MVSSRQNATITCKINLTILIADIIWYYPLVELKF